MMMKAVCLNSENSQYSTWEERVYDTARKSNITVRSWKDFEANKPILRQELFVVTSKLDLWKDATGGCLPLKKNKPFSAILLPQVLQADDKIPDNKIIQAPEISTENEPVIMRLEPSPGTFMVLYDDEIKTVYAYRVKSG